MLGPPIAYYVTWRLCVALSTRPGPDRTERAGGVVRDAGGGYHEADEEEAEESLEVAAEPAEAGQSHGTGGPG